ncbi:MAG: phosphotransferase [Phycisphaera sp.]|nr:phosphotransferase [Phycisphaera sp.]
MRFASAPREWLNSTVRFGNVLTVLAKHGFAGLLRGEEHWPTPVELREAFEELGVVFLKFGQVLSTRGDLLPREYIAELEHLQDRLPPEDPQVIRSTIESELSDNIKRLFRSFDEEPLAAATIAQVHAAVLPDGRDVVIKVQRPGLDQRIAEDLAVMAFLAATLDALVPAARGYDAPSIVREFHMTLLRELDFRREAHNIRRFRSVLEDVERLTIPAVIETHSTSRVITIERAHGERLNNYVHAHPEAANALARRVLHLFLRQVFREGMFHADPHPGNFLVNDAGMLFLYDFGMVGEVDASERETMIDLLRATVQGDSRTAAEAYLDLGYVGPGADRQAVRDEISIFLRDLREQPVSELSVGRTLESLLRLGSRHGVRNPGSLLLLARAFITLEAVIRQLDPELNILEVFGEELPGLTRKRFSASQMAADAVDMARNIDRLVRQAPHDLRRVLRRLNEGDLGAVQVREHPSVSGERERAVRLIIRTIGSGFLTIAGAVMIVGAELSITDWRLLLGVALLGVGLMGMAATGVLEKLKW